MWQKRGKNPYRLELRFGDASGVFGVALALGGCLCSVAHDCDVVCVCVGGVECGDVVVWRFVTGRDRDCVCDRDVLLTASKYFYPLWKGRVEAFFAAPHIIQRAACRLAGIDWASQYICKLQRYDHKCLHNLLSFIHRNIRDTRIASMSLTI